MSKTACLNATHYQYCMGTTPITSKTTACPGTTLCSAEAATCVEPTTATTATYPCGQSSTSAGCSPCPAGQTICCISRTQYGHIDLPGEVLGSCLADEVCANDGMTFAGNVCIKQCVADVMVYDISCTNEVFEPAPVEKPDYKAECVNAASATAGVYYLYPSDDNTCKT